MATSGSILSTIQASPVPFTPVGTPSPAGAPRGAARDVLRLLQGAVVLSPSQISEALGRSDRTVRYALRRLEHACLVAWRLDLDDPRYRLYRATRGAP